MGRQFNHVIEQCGVCGRIIRQCRCMVCDKTVVIGICGDCSDTAAAQKKEKPEDEYDSVDEYDSADDTVAHKQKVFDLLCVVAERLADRAVRHDLSKLQPVEKPIFDEFTPKLKDSTYGSDEYKRFLKEMKVALDHHYSFNRHHPEHFKNGVSGMNLIDLVEMYCDWKAASMRHADGDMFRSIDINKKRFGYSDELESIFKNTIEVFNV